MKVPEAVLERMTDLSWAGKQITEAHAKALIDRAYPVILEQLRQELERDEAHADLQFTIGQLPGAREVLDDASTPIDREALCRFLRAAVARLEDLTLNHVLGEPASQSEGGPDA